MLNAFSMIFFILLGTLDSNIKNYDEQEYLIPLETDGKVSLTSCFERSNLRDGDSFELNRNYQFRKHAKINGHFITRKEPKTFHELLNDKTRVTTLRDQYTSTYELVLDTVGDDIEYLDERDDAYDAFIETEPRLQLKIHGVMRDMLPDDVLESEEEEVQPQTCESKNPLDFCENPELRREQLRNKKLLLLQKTKTSNVIGNRKGQGESNEVLRNHRLKGTTKSRAANHNRKSLSKCKRQV